MPGTVLGRYDREQSNDFCPHGIYMLNGNKYDT